MFVYIKNLKEVTKKKKNPEELISEFSKVAEYKTITPKSISFLYSKNGHAETVILNTVSFILTSKIMRYLGIHITTHL